MSIFSSRLREAMEYRGTTQKWLADAAQTTEATISRYTNDKSEPPAIAILKDVAKALGVSSDFLLGLTNTPLPLTDIPQEETMLLSVWKRVSDYDKNVVFTLLDKYFTDKERKTIQETRK